MRFYINADNLNSKWGMALEQFKQFINSVFCLNSPVSCPTMPWYHINITVKFYLPTFNRHTYQFYTSWCRHCMNDYATHYFNLVFMTVELQTELRKFRKDSIDFKRWKRGKIISTWGGYDENGKLILL